MSAPRITFYTRPGCHLCDDARAVVAEVCGATGDAWREVDVDAERDGDGRPLADRLGELVPVVDVDGVRVDQWRVDADRLRRALLAGSARH